ncbi:MAG: hypothetical protein ACJAUP_000940 [Cellvibrionaceae bacterium]|jgi:hypothetical protein
MCRHSFDDGYVGRKKAGLLKGLDLLNIHDDVHLGSMHK